MASSAYTGLKASKSVERNMKSKTQKVKGVHKFESNLNNS